MSSLYYVFAFLHMIFSHHISAVCNYSLRSLSSFYHCELYYDFSHGKHQQINNSIFTENNFNADIVNNQSLNISHPSNMIGSNSEFSFKEYSVLFDMEFTSHSNLAYFWSADSTEYIYSGVWHNEQYQFVWKDGQFGIENKNKGPITFSSSMNININERHLVLYKSNAETTELYIDGVLQGTEKVSNSGLYSPYYTKLGGYQSHRSSSANRNFVPMKVYRYAFYSGDLTTNEIAEMCNTSITNYKYNPNTNANTNTNNGVEIFGFLPIFLIPMCVTLIPIVSYFIFRYKRKQKREQELRNMRKRMKKLKKINNDVDGQVVVHSNGILIKNEECVICMDNMKEYICTPCGHYCLCEECKEKVKKCPLCQAKCQSIIKVFK